jgi:hypothetical protein
MGTTRIMYDSVTPQAIPADAEMVAGYVNGHYAWTSADWDRFKNAVKVHITIMAVNEAGVLDVETGDATPQQAPDWVKARLAAGLQRPTLYVNRSNAPAVLLECHNAGLEPGRHFWLWLATLDGTQTTDLPAVVAIQDKGAAALRFNADSSVVFDPTWHPSPLTDAERFAAIGQLAAQITKLAAG